MTSEGEIKSDADRSAWNDKKFLKKAPQKSNEERETDRQIAGKVRGTRPSRRRTSSKISPRTRSCWRRRASIRVIESAFIPTLHHPFPTKPPLLLTLSYPTSVQHFHRAHPPDLRDLLTPSGISQSSRSSKCPRYMDPEGGGGGGEGKKERPVFQQQDPIPPSLKPSTKNECGHTRKITSGVKTYEVKDVETPPLQKVKNRTPNTL